MAMEKLADQDEIASVAVLPGVEGGNLAIVKPHVKGGTTKRKIAICAAACVLLAATAFVACTAVTRPEATTDSASANDLLNQALGAGVPVRGYDRVQFIGLTLSTRQQDEGKPGERYVGRGSNHHHFAANIKGKVDVMRDGLARAMEDTDLDHRNSTLKVFMAPEFFFRSVNGAYQPEDAFGDGGLVEQLRDLVKEQKWSNWLCIFGSMIIAEDIDAVVARRLGSSKRNAEDHAITHMRNNDKPPRKLRSEASEHTQIKQGSAVLIDPSLAVEAGESNLDNLVPFFSSVRMNKDMRVSDAVHQESLGKSVHVHSGCADDDDVECDDPTHRLLEENVVLVQKGGFSTNEEAVKKSVVAVKRIIAAQDFNHYFTANGEGELSKGMGLNPFGGRGAEVNHVVNFEGNGQLNFFQSYQVRPAQVVKRWAQALLVPSHHEAVVHRNKSTEVVDVSIANSSCLVDKPFSKQSAKVFADLFITACGNATAAEKVSVNGQVFCCSPGSGDAPVLRGTECVCPVHPSPAPVRPPKRHWYDQIRVAESGVFDIDGIRFGLEVCIEHFGPVHILRREGVEQVDVQLVPSGGLASQFSSLVTQPGGYIFNVDGSLFDIEYHFDNVEEAVIASKVHLGSHAEVWRVPMSLARRKALMEEYQWKEEEISPDRMDRDSWAMKRFCEWVGMPNTKKEWARLYPNTDWRRMLKGLFVTRDSHTSILNREDCQMCDADLPLVRVYPSLKLPDKVLASNADGRRNGRINTIRFHEPDPPAMPRK